MLVSRLGIPNNQTANSMNANRRKKLDQIRCDLQGVIDDEQSAYDNMPDSLRGGERGDQMQAAIDSMQTALTELEGIDA